MLPMALSFLAPTMVALKRVSAFLTAEELSHPYLVDESEEKEAIVVDGDFTWEAVKGEEAEEEEEKEREGGQSCDARRGRRQRGRRKGRRDGEPELVL